MVKVMLINPPQKCFNQSFGFDIYFPLGLLSIAAIIRNVCDVKIFDCLITDAEIKKTKEFTLYGTPFEKITTAIKNFNPDIVAISIPFSTQSENAKIISNICKTINPNIIVVFGGPDPSIRYRSLLEEGSCDFCVIGEGEKTFFEFVKNVHSKSSLRRIKGLAYRMNNKIYYKAREFLDNLDELPLPAYDLINVRDYLKNKRLYINRSYIHKNSISIITSRGCPYNCVFCSIKLHMGQKFRYHSPDYVIKHLRFCIEKYGITSFHFEDDNISLNRPRFEQILDKIIKNKLKIKWDTPNGIRADSLDFDLLKKIKKSGCKELKIAVESGNQHVLNHIIKKNSSLSHAIKVIKYCKQLRIRVSSFYVIGFPGESIRNMKETIDLALKLLRVYDAIPLLVIATPLYGTELYEICIKKGLINKCLTEKELINATPLWGNPLISTKDFSKDDIKSLIHDYSLKVKKELIIYDIKHPIYAFASFKRMLNNPALKTFLISSFKKN